MDGQRLWSGYSDTLIMALGHVKTDIYDITLLIIIIDPETIQFLGLH